jgi:hypothetical protein
MRPPLLLAARTTDRRLGLADRLSTAVELLDGPSPGVGLARLQIADAVEVARGVVPRAAAPVPFPRGLWPAAACVGALLIWAHFLQGWSIPGWPAARNAAVIRNEGRALTAIARQLEAAARTQGLPEARRAAPDLQALGRQLSGPRVSRQSALELLADAGRQLQAAENRVARRLGGAGVRGTQSARDPRLAPTSPADPRMDQAIREMESLTGELRGERNSSARQDLSKRLSALSDSLDEMNAPNSARQNLARARREVERDRLPAAASALGDALQDLTGLERMLGDEQALGDAHRQVQRSAERIARGGPLGNSRARVTGQAQTEKAPPPTAPGPNPVAPGDETGTPPPPGPNQGSRPGQGKGPALGAPTQRLGGTRAEEHLTGKQGKGSSLTRDLFAPGRAGSPQLPTAPVPADVAHQNDRAVAQDQIPPEYLTVIRRYFQTLGGGR